ncbi:precorrin-6B methylase 2 [Nocardia tenerifensis]|uniref:Precorrin-6B methylase 2 n=1 Tax=Nocardia tenerifensis TaxID=228006 RepID=A0A318KE01_9NOCA|nr:methyltransferase [Nocardia tenerifensis]PXX69309.1 precorrin-6B methylase 2 [Nocardia tenerifensis]
MGTSVADPRSLEPNPARTGELRRERLLMRAFQSRVGGPLLRRFADPQRILETGMGFWPSRVVLTAVESGVFTELAMRPMTQRELLDRLDWQPRAATPFLGALVDLGLLRRDRAGRYANSRQAALFLDRAKPSYIGGLMELSSTRLYDLWSGLGELLRTGKPQAEEEQGESEFFSSLYGDEVALRKFLAGMTGISTGEAMLIAARFPWRRFRTFLDVGAAQGALPVRVALTHKHIRGVSYDLPAVRPIFEEYVESFALSDRLEFVPGDMFEGPLPSADVICFGHVLHGYSETVRRELIAKAYDAVPPGGALLVYDAMSIPGRRNNLVSYLSSLNIMLEMREGFEATTAQCAGWLRDAGFTDVRQRHLIGPTSMVFGRKAGRSKA